MVTIASAWRRARRGASSTGCLVSLLVFVALLYYGVNIGELWFRYYRLKDDMREQARLASALDDGTIRRRVNATIQDIGLPDEATNNLTVRRSEQPREIRIETRYHQSVDLPFFNHTFTFRPKVTYPL